MDSASQSARVAILLYSLGITGALIIFLILSRNIGVPFDYAQEQNLRLIDIVLPTFFGYLGAASHFLFNTTRGRDIEERNRAMLQILVHGPFLIFITAIVALFFSFYTSNRTLSDSEARIDAMDFNALSRYFSICLGLLAATVSIISSYLFGAPPAAPAAKESGGT